MNRNWAIALGLIAGLAFGLTTAMTGSARLADIATAIEPIGTAFVNLVRMVVIPIVAATVFTGVVRLGDPRRLGRVGAVTIGFFLGTMVIAIIIGMTVMTLALPFAREVTAPVGDQPVQTLPGTVDFILSLIPTNVVAVAASGALLPLVVFSVLFGAAVATLPAEAQRPLTGLADAITEAMIRLVHWVLWTAPIGVFVLAASATAKSGWEMLQNLAVFVIAVLVGLTIFVVGVYLPAVRFLADAGGPVHAGRDRSRDDRRIGHEFSGRPAGHAGCRRPGAGRVAVGRELRDFAGRGDQSLGIRALPGRGNHIPRPPLRHTDSHGHAHRRGLHHAADRDDRGRSSEREPGHARADTGLLGDSHRRHGPALRRGPHSRHGAHGGTRDWAFGDGRRGGSNGGNSGRR